MEQVEYEFQITFRADADARREEAVKRLFDVFHATHSDADAITAIRPDGLVELSFSVEASAPAEAYERATPIFLDGIKASGYGPEQLEPIDLSITRVASHDYEREATQSGELQPA
ncbi:MAG: hypothetical protein WDZ37_02705 [Solirubrobacterales bacterium]